MNTDAGPSIESWLAGLGLAGYAARFRSADVDTQVLPHLTDSDLRELGVQSLGHRRKIMAAASQEVPKKALAERRFITVLFCDIVGSTPLSGKLDAETYAELLGLYHASVERVAKQYGGHVAQFLGDGALIYFGSPVPLEDAASRAAITALKLPAAVANLGEDLPRLEVRIGIASGLVVIGDTSQGDRSAVGQTLNLAARLQEQATPGSAVLSEATVTLIRDQFEVEDLGQKDLKGIERTQTIYRLGDQKSAALGANFLRPAGAATFVNRTEELARMLGARAQSASRGVSMLVSGDAGIGKSRLVTEFVSTCRAEGARVQQFACSPLGVTIPFFAFRRPLQLAAQEGDEDAARLTEMLNATDADTLVRRRELRRETIDALSDYLKKGSETKDLLVLVEDLHWADPSTIETLERVTPQTRVSRLLLMTTRDSAVLDRLPGSHHLLVTPLSRAHTCDIVRDRLGDVEGWQALVAPLADRAEGVPIFAEELASEMRHRSHAGDADRSEIPSSLQQSLQARIDRLGPGKPLLRLTASMARVCPVHIIRALWSEPLPFGEAVADLTTSGLARILPGGATEPEGLLEIKHQMIRECAYDMILAKDRLAIHQAVATLLTGAAGKDLNPAMLAEQLERGGRVAEAAAKWAEAGTLAAGQSADTEAVTLFKRALALLPRMPEGTEADDFEIDTVLKLYPALIGARGYAAANAELSQRLERLVARETNPERIMSGLFYQWIGMLTHGDVLSAVDLLSGLSRDTITGGDPVLTMLWDRMLGSTLMFHGDLAQARQVLDDMIARYSRDLHQEPLSRYGATDNFVTVLCCLSAIDALQGQPDSSARALEAAEEIGHVHTLCHTLAFGVGLPAMLRDDWTGAAAAADRLQQLATDRDLVLWEMFGGLIQAIATVQRGDVDAGNDQFDRVSNGLLKQGFSFMTPTFWVLLLKAQHAQGRMDATELADLTEVIQCGERWMLPIITRLADPA